MKQHYILKIGIVLITVLFFSCENEFDYGKIINAVKTVAYSNVSQTTAEVSGNVITDNGESLTARGICYATYPNPVVTGLKKPSSRAVLGNFICTLDNLSPSTRYYARAYATNSYGTAYGASVTFTTLKATVPIITSTTAPNSVTATTAISGGVISHSGASNVTDRGVCYSSTTTVPTVSNNRTIDGVGIGTFYSTLSSLSPNTTYYVRAYAANALGIAYGDVKFFRTTSATIPFGISITNTSSITTTTANSGGNITNDGGASVISKGVCWSNTTSSPTIADAKTMDGTGIGAFSSSLAGLSPGTTYYVRAYATNSIGTAYSSTISFRTEAITLPTGLTTTNASSLTQTTAISGGSIANDGGASITTRGVCWSNTTSSPSIANDKTIDGSGMGTFSSLLTGLSPGTTYYVRAYATNSVGTAYGNVIYFRTVGLTIPTGVTTTNAYSLTQTTGNSGGSIANDGGASITTRGVCWSSITSSPSIANDKTIDGSGVGTFSSSLTGMSPGTTYYARAYATNSVGTSYGNVISFTTVGATIPTGIITTSISSLTQNTANSGGTITTDGGSTITSKGICWSNTTSSPTISNNKTNNGSGTNSFTSWLSGLIANTTYYVRAYATNSVGTSYGNVISFTTVGATIPTGLITTSISSLTQNTANSGGTITTDGGSTITSKGICWSSTNYSPTISNSKTNNGTGTSMYSSLLSGLTANTTYYVRAYATNSVGTAYGNTVTFTTIKTLTVGQSYQGGIIAYIFVPGDSGYVSGQTHGLIATTSNQSTGAQWGCSYTSITGTSTAIGSGSANTSAIVTRCFTASIAAKICSNLSSGGYSDWFLPSYYELNKLYTNKAAIGGFSSISYWSSTQNSSTSAYSINFNNGSPSSSSKNSFMYVRAIRKF